MEAILCANCCCLFCNVKSRIKWRWHDTDSVVKVWQKKKQKRLYIRTHSMSTKCSARCARARTIKFFGRPSLCRSIRSWSTCVYVHLQASMPLHHYSCERQWWAGTIICDHSKLHHLTHTYRHTHTHRHARTDRLAHGASRIQNMRIYHLRRARLCSSLMLHKLIAHKP